MRQFPVISVTYGWKTWREDCEKRPATWSEMATEKSGWAALVNTKTSTGNITLHAQSESWLYL